MDFYIGQISYFAFTRQFRGWLPCDGQLLRIQDYALLYSLIGNTYGGDGHSTFALPDLRGRVAVAVNQPAQPGRIPVNGFGDTGGGVELNIPASTSVAKAAAAKGDETVTVQTPASQSAPLPPPPFVGLGAFICVEGVYPAPE